MIDLIEGLTYTDINVDEDPIIFLECGHFYPRTFMDSFFELEQSYQPDGGIVSDRPKSCPDCRSVIGSIYRYGRVIKNIELNVLERKHAVSIEAHLKKTTDIPAPQRKDKLVKIMKLVKISPKRRVYEAASRKSSGSVDCPKPSPDRLLRVYKALVKCYLDLVAEGSSKIKLRKNMDESKGEKKRTTSLPKA